tara:strand:+ start:1557 stop:2612 length:1056 start_codon:yes stop_codon:yes gene_type:complete
MKNFLFFFIHPAYFHVFRNTINILISKGHKVDILISSKDILEDLLINEGWKFKNIFPKGRKIKYVPAYISAVIYIILTFIKIQLFLRNKKYDLFITDDLLGINGFVSNTPTILFQDDDVTAVPETFFQHIFCNKILSPRCSNMGFFNYKKIPFDGYKELGYLHPNKFFPDIDKTKFNKNKNDKYFLIRLVSLKATHDVGVKGLNNDDVLKIISRLEEFGNVFISSERSLSPILEKYRIKIKVNEMPHVLNFASLLISDSQTMSAEAGVLGTPFIRFNDFVGRISYLDELENKYNLGYGFKSNQKDKLFEKLETLLSDNKLKERHKINRDKMLSQKIDLTDLMVDLFQNYKS